VRNLNTPFRHRVILSILGFHVDKAQMFPLVERLVYPTYSTAKDGAQHLERQGVLGPDAPEFWAVADVVRDRVAAQNPLMPVNEIVLEKLETTGGGIAFGPSSTRQTVGMKMTFRGQAQPLQWDLVELREVLEEMWRRRSGKLALVLFWGGVIVTVWPLLSELARSTKAKAVEPSNAAQLWDDSQGPRS
jgi:hypothetical protein